MKKVLVTGGGGFLGGAVIRRLLDRGETVRSFSRGYYPGLAELGVEQICGDIAHAEAVAMAAAGCDLVFHVAAKAGVWGSYESYYQSNVVGTQNVIDACRQGGVTRLVFTSSPSVVFDGKDQEGIDESAPYPATYLAHYPRTKAAAERLVNRADGPDLATVSLRPHLIWGPGDNHLTPRVIERGRRGRLRLVGRRDNLVDSIYIDNAADAHLLAADQLRSGTRLGGKNYFITNDEPVTMSVLLNGILHAAGLPPVKRRVSAAFAFGAGVLLEGAYKLLRRRREPPMTRFVALQLATAHWFDIDAAKQDLGYVPKISLNEGFARLGSWLSHKTAEVTPLTAGSV